MLWSSQYAALQVGALAVSILLALTSFLWPRLARVGYAALFGWACWVNWHTAMRMPSIYLDYGDLAVWGLYVEFIRGVVFAAHIALIIGAIAACQGLIAAGLVAGRQPARVALIGATIFLFAIAPLGVGSGFPSTLIMAIGTLRLYFAREALEGRPWANVVRWGHHPHHA